MKKKASKSKKSTAKKPVEKIMDIKVDPALIEEFPEEEKAEIIEPKEETRGRKPKEITIEDLKYQTKLLIDKANQYKIQQEAKGIKPYTIIGFIRRLTMDVRRKLK